MSRDNEAVGLSDPTKRSQDQESRDKGRQSHFEWKIDQSDADWEDARRLKPASSATHPPKFWQKHRFYWLLGVFALLLILLWMRQGWTPPPAKGTPHTSSVPQEALLVSPPPTITPPLTMTDLWSVNGGLILFARPTKLQLHLQGNIYLVDSGNHSIEKFDADGNLLFILGKRGDVDGDFWFYVLPPVYGALDVDDAGNIYVADDKNRIHKFDRRGHFLMKFGSSGEGDERSGSLAGLAVDAHGAIYATDWARGEVQSFDREGNFLRRWNVLACNGKEVGAPDGIVLNRTGHILVVNSAGDCVQEFDKRGMLVGQWGNSGRDEGELQHPVDLTLDAQGNVYIADNDNSRIQKFDANGKFLKKWGPFRYPGGVDVDINGNVYVTAVLKAELVQY